MVHLPQLPVLALKVATGTSTGWLMLSTSYISFAEACGLGLAGYPIVVASSPIRSCKSSALSQCVTLRERRPLRVYMKGALALQFGKCETRGSHAWTFHLELLLYKINPQGGGEVAQRVKCLPCKQEYLNWIPSIRVRELGVVAFT